ncbi:der1-like family domain-containing protein, conserved, putative [Eimeria tenella]|uniref:Derlin n=1 Tax=Eimeria tenella TaxID=5802 RepID=U6KGH5_EIMTE|nr:der1-like family domain-containing protein, conserved, putative [Eimeria tenella]CDJ37059.1 der1-like family domain-containing protein, conserved, putative [Eimeria tenella]|eukprot:XP_013227897.1 der1-like family domain-containing protein, conserved, putative [Eimeria tenella]
MEAGMGGLRGLERGPEVWWRSLPGVTRAAAAASLLLALLASTSLLPPRLLLLDWQLLLLRLQLWRLLSAALFVGPFSLPFLFHIYLFISVSAALEANPVFAAAAKGSYLLFLLFANFFVALLGLLVFWPTGLYFHGEGLLFACLYYWSRREALSPVSVSFLTVSGYQLPYLLLLLHLLMGRDLWLDLFGLAAGHAYYFFREVLPANGGPDLLSEPPKFLGTITSWLENGGPPGGPPEGPPGGAPRRGPPGGAPQDAAAAGGESGGPWGFGMRQRGAPGTRPFTGRGYTLGGAS